MSSQPTESDTSKEDRCEDQWVRHHESDDAARNPDDSMNAARPRTIQYLTMLQWAVFREAFAASVFIHLFDVLGLRTNVDVLRVRAKATRTVAGVDAQFSTAI